MRWSWSSTSTGCGPACDRHQQRGSEMATIEEIEKERATRKAGLAEQRKVQAAIDLDALNEAEKDHGDGSVQRVELHAMRFIPGLPTMVVVKMPEPAATKRYSDRLAANVPNATAAQEV